MKKKPPKPPDNPLITEKQAREILRGRKPHVPIEYETACKSLEACLTLDDASVWSTKADMLAAWAKMYHDDIVGRQSKQLRLKAYRKMGELALELRGHGHIANKGGARGNKPGARALLIEHGLKRGQADAATAIAKLADRVFEQQVNLARPPAPTRLAARFQPKELTSSASWLILSHNQGGDSLTRFYSFCHKYNPQQLARELAGGEVKKTRQIVRDCTEWLDEFDRFLPKEKP